MAVTGQMLEVCQQAIDDVDGALARLSLAREGAVGLFARLEGAQWDAEAPAEAKAPPRELAFNWHPDEAGRLALFPILHDDLWALRKTVEGLHWNAQEVVLAGDRRDWDMRMTPVQREYVAMQLAFFSRVDIDALEYIDGLAGEVDCMEAQFFYRGQQDQECTHAEAYALQIAAVMDGNERDRILNAARTMPVVAAIRAWVVRWFDREIPVGERLVAFAAVEGVLFSASFCALQWLREQNLLPGVTQFNSFISRDEGIHTTFTCLLVRKYLRARPPQERAYAIFRSVLDVIDSFVRESLPVRLIGMNDVLMCQYVRFQADFVLAEMGYAKMTGATNPFPFMDKLALNPVSKHNFFESRPTQYQNVTKVELTSFRIDDTPVEL